MFEFSIQKTWDEYHKDMGLGRIVLLIALFNTFLFFVGILMGGIRTTALLPVIVAILYIFFRPRFLKLGPLWQFIWATLAILITIKLNYLLIGQYDRMVDGLTRMDAFFVSFDKGLFGKNVADVFLDFFQQTPVIAQAAYDFMMFSYIIYFFLPLYGAILYYRILKRESRYYLGRYFASIVLFFNINFLFYLGIPVTGPQYYLKEEFSKPLPFSWFGAELHHWVAQLHNTFIDCFPSGHAGMAILIGIWLYRLNHIQRFVITPISLGIIGATLAMRYHYVLDIVAAVPLALICYMLSYLIIPLRTHGRHQRKEGV